MFKIAGGIIFGIIGLWIITGILIAIGANSITEKQLAKPPAQKYDQKEMISNCSNLANRHTPTDTVIKEISVSEQTIADSYYLTTERYLYRKKLSTLIDLYVCQTSLNAQNHWESKIISQTITDLS